MRGLLADVNVEGHLPYLQRLVQALGLWEIFVGLGSRLVAFADLGLRRDLDDRSIWNHCQRDGWVLFTENRNDDGPDSLHATLTDSWRDGDFPVLTLASKGRFERDRQYADRVAADVAELLTGIEDGQYRDRPRIYVPLRWP